VPNPLIRRHVRWAVPAATVAATWLVIAGTALAGGQGAPRLPARTTAQLLVAVDRPAALPSAMTAVVQETASLGLPSLPGASDPLSPLGLLSGTHTFKIWYNGPAQARVAIPVPMGETDLRLDGRDAWLWDSQTNQATHFVLPAAPAAPSARSGLSGPGSLGDAPTPQQVARQVLAAVGKTTTVATQQNVTVAGQPAYQLTLAPKDSRSLVGHVSIAIDARNALPLRVQVYARGATSPAFSVGYTSLSFARPAASSFSFRPPPGAKVETVPVAAGPMLFGSGALTGSGRMVFTRPGSAVTVSPASGRALRASRGSLTAPRSGWYGSAPLNSGSSAYSSSISFSKSSGPSSSSSPGSVTYSSLGVAGSVVGLPLGLPSALGQGWLSAALVPAGVGGPVTGGSQAGGSLQGITAALGSAATPVHGSWGSGRLLRTSLLSILLTGNGQILIGAVQPSVLYSYVAAAHG
jgi:hypothetical protein